jgi:hypothetical protein
MEEVETQVLTHFTTAGDQREVCSHLLSMHVLRQRLQISRSAIIKLGLITTKIRFSATLSGALRAACEKKGCPIVRKIPRPIKTRWNSLTACIGVVLTIREALHLILATSKYKMTNLLLTNDEWKVLSDLHNVLRVRVYLGLHYTPMLIRAALP